MSGICEKGIEYKIDTIESFQKALEIYPDFTKVLINLGKVYKKMGKYENAIQSYQKVLKLKPRHEKTWLYLGKVYLHVFKLDEAHDCINHALDINLEFIREKFSRPIKDSDLKMML